MKHIRCLGPELPDVIINKGSLKRLQRDLRSTTGGLEITADPGQYGGVDHLAGIDWPTAKKRRAASLARPQEKMHKTRVLADPIEPGSVDATWAYIYMPVFALVRVITAAGGRRWAPQRGRS